VLLPPVEPGQYTSLAFTDALVESGIAGSIGSVGDALDNALMESTIGLYKTELIDRARARSWSGRGEVERETAEWVRWFNANRLHSSIDYLSPIEYESLPCTAPYRRLDRGGLNEVSTGSRTVQASTGRTGHHLDPPYPIPHALHLK